MERERWMHTHDALLEAGAMGKAIDVDEAFTMQFLREVCGRTE
jgi:hypothetical protein